MTATVYDWNGVPVKFIDGDVIDETWEEVFGEPPTRRFPNGK